jgi:hypothetical protein
MSGRALKNDGNHMIDNARGGSGAAYLNGC